MKNLLSKFVSKPYTCCMEMYNDYGCYISIIHPSTDSIDGYRKFFNQNHFLIAYNMFDEDWDERTKLEEIYKKLLFLLEFDPKDNNICIVYKNHKKVYLSNGFYVPLPPRSIFVYDSNKVKISY